MLWMKQKWPWSVMCVLGGITLGSGCVPKAVPYEYLSFIEVPGIEVVRRERPSCKKCFGCMKAIPVEYRLERGAYVLRVVIPPGYWERATVLLEGAPGARIVPRPDRVTRDGRGSSCGGYEEDADGRELRFSWVVCPAGSVEEWERAISFDVVKGPELLGEEVLQFKKVACGWYWYVDAP